MIIGRRLRIALTLSALAPRLLASQASSCADPTIGSDRVGLIRIGMPLDSVRRRCRIVRDTTEMDEGESARVVYVAAAGDTLRMGVRDSAVSVIAVDRPAFSTRDSIRVGTPLARFLVGRHVTVLVGEGKVFLLSSDHCGNSFGLSAAAYAQVTHLTAATLARLPRSTVIDEILITGISTRFPYGPCA